MKFSIITVCFNAGNKLKKTIDSILEQTYSDFEIIVKDALSSDGCLDSIENDFRIKIYRCKDSGVYDGMNQALSHANGDYVLFLNCGDTFYSNTSLESVCFALDNLKNNNLLLFGDVFDEERKKLIKYPSRITKYFLATKSICHQAILFPKSQINNEKYDLSYKIASDFDFYIRLKYTKDVTFKHLAFPIINYEGNGISETIEHIKLAIKEKKLINKKYLSKCDYFFVVLRGLVSFHILKEKICSTRIVRSIYKRFLKHKHRKVPHKATT